MAYVRAGTRRLGSWWNSIDDLTGDIQNIWDKVTQSGGNPPPMGVPVPGKPGSPFTYTPTPTFPSPAPVDSTTNDLDLLRTWANQQKASNVAPSRMPSGPVAPGGDSGNVGELAGRWTGPGTADPSATPPYYFILAPANVIAADHRVASSYIQDRTGPILTLMQAMGLVPYGTVVDPVTGAPAGAPGSSVDIATVVKYAAIGVGLIVVMDIFRSTADISRSVRGD